MERITIDPVTRLEGHGKIEIFLDPDGEVANAYFQIPELRGFERFCVGRPVEEMPTLTNRICGVCPEAHHMAAAKAADAVYHVDPPRTAKLLRELLYSAFYVTDHTTHFYALGGPDFVVGPDAPAAERNILGVLAKVGMEVGGKVIQARKQGHNVIEMIGGRKIHPATAVPGGMTKGITEEQRAEIEKIGRWAIEFAQFSLGIFDQIVLGNDAYKEMVLSDGYTHRTYYMGLVDPNNKVNFYDGQVSIMSPDGERVGTYAPAEYRDWIAEHVEPWTYLKFPYLKKVGWKGFVDGADSGVYCATPLSRLNTAEGMATPLAQAAYERFYDTLAPKPESGRQAPGPPPPGHALGSPDRAALRGRAHGRAGDRSGDHLAERPDRSDREAHRGRRHGRGAARHAHPPLRDRRARRPHVREPDRRDHEQLRPDGDVDQEGRREPDPQGRRRSPGPAEPRRDGLPAVRPVLRLRHSFTARGDAAAGRHPQLGRRGDRGPLPELLGPER